MRIFHSYLGVMEGNNYPGLSIQILQSGLFGGVNIPYIGVEALGALGWVGVCFCVGCFVVGKPVVLSFANPPFRDSGTQKLPESEIKSFNKELNSHPRN